MEGDGAVGECAADMDDGATVAGKHAFECGHGAIDLAEEGDLDDVFEFVGGHVPDGCVFADHGVVDPDVDGAEVGFDLFGRGFDGVVVGDIERGGRGPASAELGDFIGGGLEAGVAAGDESEVSARWAKGANGGASDAGGGAGDDDDFGFGGGLVVAWTWWLLRKVGVYWISALAGAFGEEYLSISMIGPRSSRRLSMGRMSRHSLMSSR